jgi:hypothetical protein
MRFGASCRRRSVVLLLQLATGAFASLAEAHSLRPDSVGIGPSLLNFTSTLQAGVRLRYVNNSGICEQTPGVHTMSGYVDVGVGMSMVRPSYRQLVWTLTFS